MKHPLESDFHLAVLDSGVTATFKPTNSVYSFYRLADSKDIARLGPVWLGHVRHADPIGHTGEYPADEVQRMAQRLASESAKAAWSLQDENERDKLTLRGHSVSGDDDVIE